MAYILLTLVRGFLTLCILLASLFVLCIFDVLLCFKINVFIHSIRSSRSSVVKDVGLYPANKVQVPLSPIRVIGAVRKIIWPKYTRSSRAPDRIHSTRGGWRPSIRKTGQCTSLNGPRIRAIHSFKSGVNVDCDITVASPSVGCSCSSGGGIVINDVTV